MLILFSCLVQTLKVLSCPWKISGSHGFVKLKPLKIFGIHFFTVVEQEIFCYGSFDGRKFASNQSRRVFYIELLRFSPLTIQPQHDYKGCALISFSTELPSWKKFLWRRGENSPQSLFYVKNYGFYYYSIHNQGKTIPQLNICFIILKVLSFKRLTFGCCFFVMLRGLTE